MNQLARYEFVGSTLFFAILALSGIGLPFAVIYLMKQTLVVYHQVDDPEEFVRQFKAGKGG